ncbi:hypothetical protein EMIT0232MI5_30093 [Pseudomonas sp. IT-232MI5]
MVADPNDLSRMGDPGLTSLAEIAPVRPVAVAIYAQLPSLICDGRLQLQRCASERGMCT